MPDEPQASPAAESEAPPAAEPGATPPASAAAPEAAAPVPGEPPVPFDPETLPDDLKPVWRKMQAAHTKRSQVLASRRDDLALLDRFRTDPAFARTVIAQEAQRLGLPITPPQAAPNGTPAPGTPPSSAGSPPPEFVADLRASLDPSLAWMADALAPGLWRGAQRLLAPVLERDVARDRQALATKQAEETAHLSTRYPGWESEEDTMTRLEAFLASGAVHSPEFGYRRELLYRLATGNGAAIAEASQRMAEAGKRRTTTGTAARAATPNLDDRVRGAKTDRDALAIAVEHAKDELRRAGLAVPE